MAPTSSVVALIVVVLAARSLAAAAPASSVVCGVVLEKLTEPIDEATFTCLCDKVSKLVLFKRNGDLTYSLLPAPKLHTKFHSSMESMCRARHEVLDHDGTAFMHTVCAGSPNVDGDCSSSTSSWPVYRSHCDAPAACGSRPRYTCRTHRHKVVLNSKDVVACGLGVGCHTEYCRDPRGVRREE